MGFEADDDVASFPIQISIAERHGDGLGMIVIRFLFHPLCKLWQITVVMVISVVMDQSCHDNKHRHYNRHVTLRTRFLFVLCSDGVPKDCPRSQG